MKNLAELVQELEIQNERKRDLIVPSKTLRMVDVNRLELELKGASEYIKPNDLFETQMASKLGIPMNYYKKMKMELPELLLDNVNGWLEANQTKNYLIRNFIREEQDLVGRAFLSDRYHVIDNYDVLFASLQAIKETGFNVEIKSADVTDNRLYIHVTAPEIEVNAKGLLENYLKENDGVGNGIISGFIITNSEVGKGSFEIKPRAVIIKCNNGLIGSDSLRRVHLGGKLETGEIQWSENTKRKNMELVISQTQDAIKTYLSEDYLTGQIEKLDKFKSIDFENPFDAVQNISKHLSIPKEERYNILQHFMSDGEINGLGAFNAFTLGAQKMDADNQYEVEKNIVEVLDNRKLIKKLDTPFKN